MSTAQPVTVIHEPTQKVVHRCATVREAEEHIAQIEQTDPQSVHRGDYGISAPEQLVN